MVDMLNLTRHTDYFDSLTNLLSKLFYCLAQFVCSRIVKLIRDVTMNNVFRLLQTTLTQKFESNVKSSEHKSGTASKIHF